MKFCGLCFLADARTSRFPPQVRLTVDRQSDKKFPSPFNPLPLFARLLEKRGDVGYKE